MRKNILFYIPNIDQSWGGVRQYSFNILNPEFTFYIYNENKDKLFIDIIDRNDNFSLVQSAVDSKFKIKYKNILYKIIYFLTLKKINLKKSNSFDLLLDKYDIDIVHCPYQFIPKADNVKLITTMHDVQELYFPEFFSPEQRAYRAVNYFDEKGFRLLSTHCHNNESWIVGTKFFVCDPDFLRQTWPTIKFTSEVEEAFSASIADHYKIDDVVYLINSNTGEADEVEAELREWRWEHGHRLSKFKQLDDCTPSLIRIFHKGFLYQWLRLKRDAQRSILRFRKALR